MNKNWYKTLFIDNIILQAKDLEGVMSRMCQVTGKKVTVGNNVSHANNKTKRKFKVNLHKKRFWVESEKRFVTLKVSAKGMRIIDKKGIDAVLEQIRSQ